MTKANRTAIIVAARMGATPYSIAKQLGLKEATVRSTIDKAGIRQTAKVRDYKAELVREAASMGATYRFMKTQFGMGSDTYKKIKESVVSSGVASNNQW